MKTRANGTDGTDDTDDTDNDMDFTNSENDGASGATGKDSSKSNGRDREQSLNMNDAYQKTISALGVARDGIAIGGPAVNAGFGAANASVDAGFATSRRAVASSFRAASLLGFIDNNTAEKAQQSIESAVNVAHSVTKKSLGASATITRASLQASDSILSLTGAQQGETLRRLSERIASQNGDRREKNEAILGLVSLLLQAGGDLTASNPLALMTAARGLATLHENRRRERVEARNRSDGSDCDLLVPPPSDKLSLSRHMRYAAAAYGPFGIGDCWSRFGRKSAWTCDEDVIRDLTGVERNDIICIGPGEGMYKPAHFVAVSHQDKEVVIAIRGTMSMQDVLVDLVCHNKAFSSIYDGNEGGGKEEVVVEGKAHGGFLKSAQRLAGELHESVAKALSDHPGYRLVIVGHSLGGGVATLLALLWARIPIFRSRDICGYSFASPCSVCASISQAPFTRRHVRSVVYGDDLVSRLSLATFRELQRDIVTASMEPNASSRATRASTGVSSDADEEKLYCAGRVWWLESKEYEPHPIIEINPVNDLNRIELFSDMITAHMPWAYIEALEKLDNEDDSGDDEVDFCPIDPNLS